MADVTCHVLFNDTSTQTQTTKNYSRIPLHKVTGYRGRHVSIEIFWGLDRESTLHLTSTIYRTRELF